MTKKTFALLTTIFLLIAVLSSPARAQTAATILGKMIKAQGGKKVLSKTTDMILSGSIQLPQMGLDGELTMNQKEPDKMRMDIEVMGMIITQAYDGETAWMIDPQSGYAQEMDERMAKDMARNALGNDAMLHPEKYGITYTAKGKETIEGKSYLVLVQTFKDGYQATHYIDPDSYLIYKSKGITINQMGIEVDTESIMSDYKDVEGRTIAHQLTTFQDGVEFMTMIVTDVLFNTGLEDAFFQMK